MATNPVGSIAPTDDTSVGFFYFSAAMGKVHVIPDENGVDLDCPADLDDLLLKTATKGEKLHVVRVWPSQFQKLVSCFKVFGARPLTATALQVMEANAGLVQAFGGQAPPERQRRIVYLCDATNAQLWAEGERRGLFATAADLVARLTDGVLKAECEKRFPGPVNEYTRLAEEHRQTVKERDAARLEVIRISERLAAERDEWKARAERAEESRSLHRSIAASTRRSRDEMHAEFMRLLEFITPEQAQGLLETYREDASQTPPPLKSGQCRFCTAVGGSHFPNCRLAAPSDAAQATKEHRPSIEVEHTPDSGRGIQRLTLPSGRPVPEPLAFLDEDLLADDVG